LYTKYFSFVLSFRYHKSHIGYGAISRVNKVHTSNASQYERLLCMQETYEKIVFGLNFTFNKDSQNH